MAAKAREGRVVTQNFGRETLRKKGGKRLLLSHTLIHSRWAARKEREGEKNQQPPPPFLKAEFELQEEEG